MDTGVGADLLIPLPYAAPCPQGRIVYALLLAYHLYYKIMFVEGSE